MEEWDPRDVSFITPTCNLHFFTLFSLSSFLSSFITRLSSSDHPILNPSILHSQTVVTLPGPFSVRHLSLATLAAILVFSGDILRSLHLTLHFLFIQFVYFPPKREAVDGRGEFKEGLRKSGMQEMRSVRAGHTKRRKKQKK